MTRDYAKKKRPAAKRKPALPPWLWMGAGLLVGLFVAFLVYINRLDRTLAPPKVPTHSARPAAPEKRAAAKPAPTTATASKESESKMRFDFYKILPEYEVVVPDEDLSKPGAPLPAGPGHYLIQAGSFRSVGEADTRRAQLALLGLVSRVQQVTVDGKDTWHRVQAGPYESVADLEKARELLKKNNIEFILLKEKGSSAAGTGKK